MPPDNQDGQRPQVIQPYPMASSPQPANSKKNPLKIVFIILAGVFAVAVIAAVLLSSNTKQPAPSNQTSPQNSTSSSPGKANAIDVENTNNSISQTLGGLNDEQDFPATQLDDKSLGL